MNKYMPSWRLLLPIALGLLIWLLPTPQAITAPAWGLLAIFVGTILLVMTGAMPMGAGTLLGLTTAVVSNVLTFERAFVGYQSKITWLILIAFFIAQGFLKTGLGKRIAYLLISVLGKKNWGLGYGIVLADFFLSPVVPSVTARSGGLVFPIVQSLSHALGSKAEDGTARRIGKYLVLVAFQSAPITSAMFLTAMAANPLAAKFGLELGVNLDWPTWAYAAIVPGLVNLMIVPILMLKISPPEIKDTNSAVAHAKGELQKMGKMSGPEKNMFICFVSLLILWCFGSFFHINATAAALMGLIFLLLTSTLKWQNLLKLTNAWETFIWFGAIIGLAKGISDGGVPAWFAQMVSSSLGGLSWPIAVAVLFLIYFYAHYFFASSTAQLGALFLPFVMSATALGAPAVLVVALFAFGSNIFGGITHYSMGPAPILFGAGFVPLKEWWRVGFIFSMVNIVIWLGVGSIWWKFIGLY